MDEPRDHHTKWTMPKREKEIEYDIAYVWNLRAGGKIQVNLYKTEVDP